jgi:transcriptional regulator with XRE-family HTH domain
MTTNFDRYYSEQLNKPGNKKRFETAGLAIDIALQLTRLREEAGYSQAQLARELNTSQQQISRLESPSYEGHSVSMLRRIAEVLNTRVVVSFESLTETVKVHEPPISYKHSRRTADKTERDDISSAARKNRKARPTAAKKVSKKSTRNGAKKAAKKRSTKANGSVP